MSEWITIARATDPARAAEWQAVFGGDTVPVKSIIPTRANLPGHHNALIYEVDLSLLTAEMRARLISATASKFGLAADEVARDLDSVGMPILADGVIVSSSDPRLPGLFVDETIDDGGDYWDDIDDDPDWDPDWDEW